MPPPCTPRVGLFAALESPSPRRRRCCGSGPAGVPAGRMSGSPRRFEMRSVSARSLWERSGEGGRRLGGCGARARRIRLSCVCGRDSCEDPAHLAGVETLTPPTPPALTFESGGGWMIGAPVEVIEGIVAANSVSVLVGESGASKTFLLLSWAASVADGKPWLGRRVRGGSVGYLSFEGDALGLRLRALREVAGAQLREPLRPASSRSALADRRPPAGREPVARRNRGGRPRSRPWSKRPPRTGAHRFGCS